MNKLLLPLKMFFADGPYTHEDEYGRHPGFVVFSCCSEIVDKPHAADCSWFNLLKYFEQAVNEGKPTPGQIGGEEALKFQDAQTLAAYWVISDSENRRKMWESDLKKICEALLSVTGQGEVERLREALESAEEWMAEDGCDCGTDEPGTCGLCLVRALLTSKPEPVAQGHDGNCVPVRTPDDGWQCDCGYAPVAPVRKWKAGEVVGERRCSNPDCHTTLHVFMHNLSPEVQDALNGRKV